jgi:DNA-binding MarR family transcriptional regulator
VQATAAPLKTATPKRVATAILDLWQHLMHGSGGRLFQVIEELDLSLTQMKVLGALGIAEEEPSMKGVSEGVGCSLPNASRAVETLQQRGWVERREDADDRRVKRLRITPAGRDALQQINTARLEGIEEYAASISPEQRTALLAALTALPHAEVPR